jgi:HSP20 family molecular chaperone IbpA
MGVRLGGDDSHSGDRKEVHLAATPRRSTRRASATTCRNSASAISTRTIHFPALADADKIQANLADGILSIRVPKAEAANPKRLTVKAS